MKSCILMLCLLISVQKSLTVENKASQDGTATDTEKTKPENKKSQDGTATDTKKTKPENKKSQDGTATDTEKTKPVGEGHALLNMTQAPLNTTQAPLNMTQATTTKAPITNASSETMGSKAPVTSKKTSASSVKKTKPTLSVEEWMRMYKKIGIILRKKGVLPTTGTKETKPENKGSQDGTATDTEKTKPENKESQDGTATDTEKTKPENKASQDGTATDTEKTKPGPKPLSRTPDSSHFAVVFLVMIALLFGLYALYHNRQKIIAVVVEGRSINGRGGRERYRKLDSESGLEPEARIKNSNEVYVY